MGCGFLLLGGNPEVMSRSFQRKVRRKSLLFIFLEFKMIINTG